MLSKADLGVAHVTGASTGIGPATVKALKSNEIRERYLKLALVVSGIAFLLIYPLGLVWPSGWVWHGGEGSYYLQMISGVYAVLGIFLIAAARNPAQNRSLISFTIWSSVAHAAIMAVQALYDGHEHSHLVGDVPARLITVPKVLHTST